jgi:hypothetical protein
MVSLLVPTATFPARLTYLLITNPATSRRTTCVGGWKPQGDQAYPTILDEDYELRSALKFDSMGKAGSVKHLNLQLRPYSSLQVR